MDLSTAGYIDGTFPNSGAQTPTCGDIGFASTLVGPLVNEYVPVAKIGYGNSVYVYEQNGSNWFGVAQIAFRNVPYFSNPLIPVIAAYNIDKKMDDGLPTTGAVQATYLYASQITVANASNANPDKRHQLL